MDKVHVSSPEAVVFLKMAAAHLEQFRRDHGKYPADWAELNMSFVNGPYHLSDPGIYPPPGTGIVWQPKQSNYRYRLAENAERTAFSIYAMKPDGRVEYVIESGQDQPIKLDQDGRPPP